MTQDFAIPFIWVIGSHNKSQVKHCYVWLIMDSNHNNWRLVESSKALKWPLTWTSLTYVCPNIANLKTQLALLSNLKVKLGCIIRTKRANFFLAYSSTFVTHVVTLESFQDFLIKLDMKPRMHLVEISIFSLNNVTVRLTKIMNNLFEHLKILIFKVIFLCWKLIESFQKKIYLKNIGLGDQLLIKNVFENFDF